MPTRLNKDTESFIDAVRGLAALGVLINHCFDFGIRGVFGEDLATAPDGWRRSAATVGHGSFFVWIFFVISGLCIHLSIARSLTLNTFSLRRYLAARVTRIYPLFMLGLGLAVAVWWFTDTPADESLSNPWPPLLSSLLSLQIFTGTFPNYMPSWSISNEMIYYVAWPCALLVLRRKISTAIKVSTIASLSVCVGIATLWFVFHQLETSAAIKGLWIVTALFPVWLAGALLADRWEEISTRVTRRIWFTSFALCLVAEFALARVKFIDGSEALVHSMGILAIPGVVLLIAGARYARLGSRTNCHPLTRWLGQFSYPCYALHMPLLVLLNRQPLPRLGDSINSDPLLRSVIQFVPAFIVLAAIGPWLERSIMAWRSHVLTGLRS